MAVGERGSNMEAQAEADTGEIPVILLTVLSNAEDVLKGLSCGANGYIGKPYKEYSASALVAREKVRRREAGR